MAKSKSTRIKNNITALKEHAVFIMSEITPSLLIVIILFSFATITLSRYFFIFDIFSHFQLQIICVGALISIAIAYTRPIYAAIGLVYFGTVFALLAYPAQTIDGDLKSPDIIFLNVNYENSNIDPITASIKRRNPDSVALVESNSESVAQLTKHYGAPAVLHNDNFKSCVIFTKNKDQIEKTYVDLESEYPICVVRFKDYTLLAAHPFPPINPKQYRRQQSHFEHLAQLIKDEQRISGDFVLVGDFNSTYYSALYRKHFGEYFKQNYYSWAAHTPLSIPIDHALSSKEIRVSKSASPTSDHDMLLIQME